MKAMIMAAGVGSRLMPMTIDIPKPMVPMGNKPLMENIVNLLKHHEFKDIIANLHYQSSVITNYFDNGSKFGVSIQYSKEDELMGTAGGVKKCDWFLDETFVVVSGDALTDINLTDLVNAHKRKGALATIALKEVEDVEHFGIVITDEEGKIDKFQEKPRKQEALSKTANTGIYIFEPEIFKYIPNKQFYDFGKQVFPHLVKIKAPFYGIAIDEYWCDVGNIDTYRQAHNDILENRVKVQTSGKVLEKDISKVLIDDSVEMGKNINFRGNVVIGENCKIGDNSSINNSVIWANTVVGEKSVLNNCVIGDNCNIGKQVIINQGAVVASGCFLNDKITIAEGMKVFNSSGDKLKAEN
ncbi:Mannose-1-phosphate guanylyltransferase / Phosphomannomutase [Candidatus Syntrophocurvum alkaliphilum]|uniref:Mannose-1-phosphate guanylyltransferase / Phosphomannomutase n=1 Tax=Candidatus Syntrophocurvum alkaliphilum TaxID=2293317 RepID=A0A6I6DIL3_9FIRM|nr:NDP-sugar synthase [Candidatus Syntrophocurvum alkaliphilum]QGU00853.1 Mannose-1-phosphate guanylyltransferase / Phosphomannomutase [Candidatus Syntrophocurvum alkaliphilum]